LGGVYFDAEQPEDRLRLELAWTEIVRRRKLVVIDEARSWPKLFSRPRGALAVDRKRVGRLLLLGSVSPAWVRCVSRRLC
jgi:hypothetical protein